MAVNEKAICGQSEGQNSILETINRQQRERERDNFSNRKYRCQISEQTSRLDQILSGLKGTRIKVKIRNGSSPISRSDRLF